MLRGKLGGTEPLALPDERIDLRVSFDVEVGNQEENLTKLKAMIGERIEERIKKNDDIVTL